MDNKEYLDIIKKTQRCQRNWNLDKTVDDQTIDFLIESGYNVATKQNLNSFKIVCLKTRKEIEKWKVVARNPDSELSYLSNDDIKSAKNNHQNPQTDANLLFLFFINMDERTSQARRDRECGPDPSASEWRVKKHLEVGLAAQAISTAAVIKGMRSGMCGCIWSNIIKDAWVKDWKVNKHDLALMMGVGYPLHKDHTAIGNTGKHKTSFAKRPYEKIIQ